MYVSRAYPPMIPYVKGFHLTVEMWRGNQDSEQGGRWKLPEKERLQQHMDAVFLTNWERKRQPLTSTDGPVDGRTPPAPRSGDNLAAPQFSW